MKPPYGVCHRYCRSWDECRPIIEALEAYHLEHGHPSAVAIVIADSPCPCFRAKEPK